MSGSDEDRDDYGAPDDRLMHGKDTAHLLAELANARAAPLG